MATRRYIGARYVPKFYQNSVDGSAQWEANVVYEPLMYVTLTNGHMYLSRKQVPATVGSPVDNIDYWLDVANYNGYISQLQAEIDDINDVKIPAINSNIALKQDITDNNLNTTDKTVVGAINELDGDIDTINTNLALKQDATDNNLDTSDKTIVGAINELNTDVQDLSSAIVGLKNRKYIFVGDSYGDETYLPDVQGWWRYLANYLGISTSDYYEACENGGGFNRTDTTKRYISILQGIENNVTDKESITDIVIAGGYNDIDDSITDITARATELKSYINTTYPNARIWIAPIGWTSDVTYSRLNLFRRMIYNYLSLSSIGFLPIDGGYLALHNYTLMRDPAHPTSNGNAEIAKYLYAGLTYTNYKTVVNQIIQSMTADATGSFIGSPLFNANMDGNNITAFVQFQMQYATPMSITADGTNKCPIGTLADGLVKGSDDGNTPIAVNCYYDDGTNYNSITGLLFIENGVVSVAPFAFNGRTYESITVSRIGIPRTKLSLDALNC